MERDRSFQLLVGLILENEYLDPSDRQTVKDIIYGLNLTSDGSFDDINNKWEMQIELETLIVYLVRKYTKVLAGVSKEHDDMFADKRLSVDDYSSAGKKYTAEDKKSLVRLDPDLNVLIDRSLNINLLVQDLQDVMRIVFGRNQKLDHLTVNYRRELANDGRS